MHIVKISENTRTSSSQRWLIVQLQDLSLHSKLILFLLPYESGGVSLWGEEDLIFSEQYFYDNLEVTASDYD